jgi:hypothetical protein
MYGEKELEAFRVRETEERKGIRPRFFSEIHARRPITQTVIIFNVLFLGVYLVSQMLLASERIELRDGGVILGYVLSDEAGWTSVLRDQEQEDRQDSIRLSDRSTTV